MTHSDSESGQNVPSTSRSEGLTTSDCDTGRSQVGSSPPQHTAYHQTTQTSMTSAPPTSSGGPGQGQELVGEEDTSEQAWQDPFPGTPQSTPYLPGEEPASSPPVFEGLFAGDTQSSPSSSPRLGHTGSEQPGFQSSGEPSSEALTVIAEDQPGGSDRGKH